LEVAPIGAHGVEIVLVLEHDIKSRRADVIKKGPLPISFMGG
jgi:hypothetical protein